MTDQENVASIVMNKPALDNLRALTLFAGATLLNILKDFNDKAEKEELTDEEREKVALFIDLFKFAEHIHPILIDASQALDEELESPTNQITVSKHLH
jgi:hypothetical protein